MRVVLLGLACMACAGLAQNAAAPSEALSKLLQALDPAAGWHVNGAVLGRGPSSSNLAVSRSAERSSAQMFFGAAEPKKVVKKVVPKKVVKKVVPKKVVKKVVPKKVVKKVVPKKVVKKVVPKKVVRKFSSIPDLPGFTTGAAADSVGRTDDSWVSIFDSNGLGYFDPAGFTIGASEKQIRAYREAELKHGRISMLAALGFVVGEKFHPLFGGDIDTPSAYALLDDRIWEKVPSLGIALILLTIVGLEVLSAYTVFRPTSGKEAFKIPSDYEAGDIFEPFGSTFDPLGLRPQDPVEFEVMQTKELNNGRLAMLAIMGMFLQELKTGQPLFG